MYHGGLAWLAAMYYGQPSRRLTVIGVTGTAGKSTTVKMLAHILNLFGKKCGYITTVSFYDGNTEYINKHGLSMPGGPLLQKQLKTMADNGCAYAIVECTSEGLAQNRHMGIGFSGAVFTNLSPAHLDTHGSFENYRAAKGKLFEGVKQFKKSFFVVNVDDPNSDYFLQFSAKEKIGVTGDEHKKQYYALNNVLWYHDVEAGEGVSFVVEQTSFSIPMAGEFNATNAALAVATAHVLGVSLEHSSQALGNFSGAAGRMEEIPNVLGIKVFVDYAPEPAAMQAALTAVNHMPHNRIIHMFGSTGGHRDVAKRAEFGRISARLADVIVITNDDVYETDPQVIATNIQEGISEVLPEQRKVKNIQTILDRKEAIAYALSIARPNDIVLFTGKGSEQFLVLPDNQRIEWDEREEVKKILNKIEQN